MIKIECTPKELKEIEAILGPCSCDPAWSDRDLSDPQCRFCDFGYDVLLLIRQREALQAERDHLRKLVDCTRYFEEHVPEEK